MTKDYSNKHCVRCKKKERVCDDVEFYGFVKVKQKLEDEYQEVPFCICYECGGLGNCEDGELFIGGKTHDLS